MANPLFISVEGGEGVGKSHFVAGLVAALREQGILVFQTREPGGTFIADRIRSVFVSPPPEEPIEPITELCLVSGARHQHITHAILPRLKEQQWVITDRFADSTRVYQGRVGGVAQQIVEQMIEVATQGVGPDLTFLLDCPVEVSLSRLSKRSLTTAEESSRYDQAVQSTHETIRNAYLALQAQFPQRIRVIDARQTPETMVRSALALIEEWQHAQQTTS